MISLFFSKFLFRRENIKRLYANLPTESAYACYNDS